MNPSETKKKLRQQLKLARKNVDGQHCQLLSSQICKKILNLQAFIQATKIAFYLPFAQEVSLLDLLSTNKHFYLPVVQDDLSLKFCAYTSNTELNKNQFQIFEPRAVSQYVNPAVLDIIFIPMLGFTRRGQRLGMGKGCYDRTLENITGPLLIGVAYGFQEIIELPHESHDRTLDMIITEKDVFDTSS